LPAAAGRLIELHDGQEFVEPDSRKIKLCWEQVLNGIQGIQLCIPTAAISDIGKTQTILERRDQRFLLLAAFTPALMRDQAVDTSANAVLIVFSYSTVLHRAEPARIRRRFQPACRADRERDDHPHD
jgi:hypothetical protein